MKLIKKYNKKASILVYTIILVNIVLVMSVIILSNTVLLESNISMNNINKTLLNWIITKSELSKKYTNHLNSNWNWIIDNIGCPTTVVMSWVVNYSSSSSSISYSGGILCKWIHNSEEFKIYFNSWFTDFGSASYDWSNIFLSWKTWTFLDIDDTFIDFSSYTNSGDNIDDDFNSDNYQVNSSWSYDYPDNYSDDDILARKTLYWYISPDDTSFKNIFWNNAKINEYIDNNTNNWDNINSKLWTSSWYLILDIDTDFDIKLLKFDKTKYDSSKELSILEEINYSGSTTNYWYIQNDLTLSWNITWSEYTFDLVNNDYAIFLKNTGSWVLFYKLYWETLNWSWIYINPINDTYDNFIKTFSYDMINLWGKYIWKMLEIVWKKE